MVDARHDLPLGCGIAARMSVTNSRLAAFLSRQLRQHREQSPPDQPHESQCFVANDSDDNPVQVPFVA
jgi:hypothetical protein